MMVLLLLAIMGLIIMTRVMTVLITMLMTTTYVSKSIELLKAWYVSI